jgi:hypothetical protein
VTRKQLLRLDAMCDDKGATWDHSDNDRSMLIAARDELARLTAENAALVELAKSAHTCLSYYCDPDLYVPQQVVMAIEMDNYRDLKRRAGL